MTVAPLTPPDCDLRTFPYMPLYVDRLLQSEFFSRANDAEFRAGFILWTKAYREVPAGSLPDDIRSLTRLAELGQDTAKMKRVRPAAMRGWILCSDGRLYHPVVAEVVIEAWIERLKAQRKGIIGNAKRWGGNLTAQEVEEKLVDACRHLLIVKPDADLKGIPTAILQRSHKDRPTIAERHPTAIAQGSPKESSRTSYSDRKYEVVPTEHPSQEIQSGEIVPLTRAGARDEPQPPVDDDASGLMGQVAR